MALLGCSYWCKAGTVFIVARSERAAAPSHSQRIYRTDMPSVWNHCKSCGGSLQYPRLLLSCGILRVCGKVDALSRSLVHFIHSPQYYEALGFQECWGVGKYSNFLFCSCVWKLILCYISVLEGLNLKIAPKFWSTVIGKSWKMFGLDLAFAQSTTMNEGARQSAF